MKFDLSSEQRANPDLAGTARAVRTCVHCGFCLATCPTYVLLGDELDSPRGRIYQVKEMLESGGPPPAETVKHVDRCLSCLACVTTCPSDVDYMRLIDYARAYIEAHYVRPWPDRMLRAFLAFALPRKNVFRSLLRLAVLGRPIARILPQRLAGMLVLAPASLPKPDPAEVPQMFATAAARRARVALLTGCAQPVLAPQINAAAIRYLNRHGVDVEVVPGTGCCGALPYHLGKTPQSRRLARTNIAALANAADEHGLDAIVVTASGCGTTLKDYGAMFAGDRAWAERAARVAALAKDVSEVVGQLAPPAPAARRGLVVAYQSACSLQHGQRIVGEPVRHLEAAGYVVVAPKEAHLCCGSAGTYNLLQPELAGRLRDRKVEALEATGAAVVATGNIGCMTHLAAATRLPVVHTIELLDWATGGPEPATLAARRI